MQSAVTDASYLNSITHDTNGLVYFRRATQAQAGEGGGHWAHSLLCRTDASVGVIVCLGLMPRFSLHRKL